MAKVTQLVLFVGAFHLHCVAQRTLDISGEWVVSGGSGLVTKTHLWIAMETDGAPKAVLYAAYDDPEPVALPVILRGSTVTFTVEPLHLSYIGTLSADGDTITGTCTAENQSHSVDFRRSIDTRPITVQALEQTLAAVEAKPDAQVAAQLRGIRLVERLGSTRLSSLEASMPRPEALQALIALADSSAFLDPPADEITATQSPDRTAQKKMLALVAGYVARTVPQLPNFTATRTTTTYQRDLSFKEPWHATALSHALVFYSDGQETQHSSEFEKDPDLATRGEFGPILSAAMHDITKNDFAWSRWEHGGKGPLAVFRYRADADNSHYQVEGRFSGYVGEITIDPADGSIVRLALKADMEPANPLLIADVMIEYGPVVIGDRSYICPRRSVALSKDLRHHRVNNVVFNSYHLFHAKARILPAGKPRE